MNHPERVLQLGKAMSQWLVTTCIDSRDVHCSSLRQDVMGDGYDYVMGDGMGDSVYQVMGTTRIGHWYYGVTLEE